MLCLLSDCLSVCLSVMCTTDFVYVCILSRLSVCLVVAHAECIYVDLEKFDILDCGGFVQLAVVTMRVKPRLLRTMLRDVSRRSDMSIN